VEAPIVDRTPNRKLEIRRIASDLIAARGFDAVSVRDIATAAGITVPTLYWYIGSKQQLLLDLIQGVHQQLYDRLAAVAARDAAPAEKLRAILSETFALMAGEPAYTLAYREGRSVAPGQAREIAPTRRQIDAIVRQVIDDARAQGEWTGVSTDIANLSIWSIIRFAPEWFRPGGRETPEELAEKFADVLLHGFLNAGPGTTPLERR
jgi:AcrR family transcriptional regulator